MQLKESKLHFRQWLDVNAPYLLHLWDWDNLSLSSERVDSYLTSASHGESIMCKFAVGVWLGRNEYNFDIIVAASILGREQRLAISSWVNDPMWP